MGGFCIARPKEERGSLSQQDLSRSCHTLRLSERHCTSTLHSHAWKLRRDWNPHRKILPPVNTHARSKVGKVEVGASGNKASGHHAKLRGVLPQHR